LISRFDGKNELHESVKPAGALENPLLMNHQPGKERHVRMGEQLPRFLKLKASKPIELELLNAANCEPILTATIGFCLSMRTMLFTA
jgi:hypothetical protein